MPCPYNIAQAEKDVRRAREAAQTLGAQAQYGLSQAEDIMAEVRHYAYTAADEPLSSQAATRLLSSILGFEITVVGLKASYADCEGYKRLKR